MPAPGDRLRAVATALLRWVDSHAGPEQDEAGRRQVDWLRVAAVRRAARRLPRRDLGRLELVRRRDGRRCSTSLRMFAITGFYHRYFSHQIVQDVPRRPVRLRGARASRRSSAARSGGPRTTATTTRTRTRAGDVHSPRAARLLWSHVGLDHCRARTSATRCALVPDLAQLPRAALPRPLRHPRPGAPRRRAATALGACARDARRRRSASPGPQTAGLGLLHLDGRAASTATVHDQLAGPPVRHGAATRPGRQPQQLAARR